MKERDRYLKIVEWSEEDQCYIGSVPGWIGKCCHGNKEEEVYRKLCQIVSELHQALATRAMQTGDSLNNFCIKSLKKSLSKSDNVL